MPKIFLLVFCGLLFFSACQRQTYSGFKPAPAMSHTAKVQTADEPLPNGELPLPTLSASSTEALTEADLAPSFSVLEEQKIEKMVDNQHITKKVRADKAPLKTRLASKWIQKKVQKTFAPQRHDEMNRHLKVGLILLGVALLVSFISGLLAVIIAVFAILKIIKGLNRSDWL